MISTEDDLMVTWTGDATATSYQIIVTNDEDSSSFVNDQRVSSEFTTAVIPRNSCSLELAVKSRSSSEKKAEIKFVATERERSNSGWACNDPICLEATANSLEI